ncbi:hypothetical protein [Marinobacter alexandrii]|jgi:hypothetical protein|uniref:hypothetical protein n=1 Tax=Marinobacter alexandrii TaxID=2570351 RepID=UPI002ABD4E11|nr:hypothetical protein [Marinobacter alexandrii]
MRADLVSRTASASRFLATLFFASALVACKTEKDPDDPTIIGVPPAEAYLGVEYYYNFGAYGGERILDYTLTNAPSWLALEDTNNKARQGIIMRGVPGLGGGSRGEADLGRQLGINLVSTDGEMAGVQPFDIEVKYNALSLANDTFTEGKNADSGADPEESDERCEVPDLDTSGEHSFTINQYAEDGSVSGTKTVTAETQPVLVRVLLDQPSVTRVAVAFELTSQYNPNSCDKSPDTAFLPPHQRCDHSKANEADATVGHDIVALGSDSGSRLEELDYLVYQQDESGTYSRGVVTLEPGITECYIRLEVIDDSFPEKQETAELKLTEVRSGLAGLGPNNKEADTALKIDDNEPLVSIQTEDGGARDALNVGDAREYLAVLTGDRDEPILARLEETRESDVKLGAGVVTERWINGSWSPSDELEFPVGVNEVRFRIRVPDGSYSNPELDDRFLLLGLDQEYQAGRENYARAIDESVLRVSVNEQIKALALNESDGFVATDIDVSHQGRVFVAGYDSLNSDRVRVRVYSQKGSQLQDILISSPGDTLSRPKPRIAAVKREVARDKGKVDRFEFVVSYSTDSAVAGTSAQGGADIVTTRYWFDEASNGGEYVESWTIRTGTSADDRVQSVRINAESGYVLIAGETAGTWPKQTNAGGMDSFLQRIDSELDGANEVPRVAWTRQVGSSANDAVVGAAARSVAPLLFGSVAGSVNGEPVLGGVDAFFYSTTSGERGLAVFQVGSEADDPLTDAIYESNQMWLLGTTSGSYRLLKDKEGNRSLERGPLNSQSGFLIAYTTTGLIRRAFTLNDAGDQSNERLTVLMAFGNDMVTSGATEGRFDGRAEVVNGDQGILARLSLVEDDPDSDDKDGSASDSEEEPYKNEWRYQLAKGDSEFTALANYRDDEIVALTRVGRDWMVLVFSPEGELLSALD